MKSIKKLLLLTTLFAGLTATATAQEAECCDTTQNACENCVEGECTHSDSCCALDEECANSETCASMAAACADDTTDPDISVKESTIDFLKSSGFARIAQDWRIVVMLFFSCLLLYLAIVKKYEPLLLLPIAFGMLLTNLPGAGMFNAALFADGHVHWEMFRDGAGLLDYLYLGVKLGIYPCLILNSLPHSQTDLA